MNFALPNMLRAAGAAPYTAATPTRRGWLQPLSRIRFQLLGGLFFAVLLPALIRSEFALRPGLGSLQNTVLATAIAVCVGTYAIRKMMPFPGVQATEFLLPTFTTIYAGVAVALLLLRVDYSRFQLLASFLVAVPWFWFVTVVERRFKRPLLAVLPVGNFESLTKLTEGDWLLLESSRQVPRGVSGIVADLRADLDPAWEKLLATSALNGLPVYHSKHVAESLTGRVEIEHLSENSLGCLLPSSVYLKLKRMIDTLGVFLALPVLLPIIAVAAFLIKREDGGPILYTQPRIGLGGKVFTIFKLRTMTVHASEGNHFTDGDDPRVTRVGKFLRRSRIDELPQAWNILKGEMSWIGPRPESLPLAQSYEQQIPFYSYRHIVRPGITGWAQVQQGYAADVQSVTTKLQYNFFYIKHFSPWLDLLITARTVRTILTGFGAR